MEWYEYIGLFAGLCLAVANIPQIIRIVKTHDTSAISLYMYIIYCIGIIAWLTYGIILKSVSIIVSNSISLSTASFVLVAKTINIIRNKEKV